MALTIDVFEHDQGPHWLTPVGPKSVKYSDDQERDERGRWTSGASSSAYPPHDPHGLDTQARYKRPDGSYTPERAALHQAIIDKTLKGVTPVDRPIAYFLGGGPASGKSTLVASGFSALPQNAATIDADAIKAQLPEYREGVAAGRHDASSIAHEESSDVSKLMARAAAHARLNMVLDGTGDSGYDKLAGKVAAMRAAGHGVEATYVTVPTEVAVQRSNARGEQTGRHVPESFIRETHATVSQILPKAMAEGLFDKVTLWDTSGKGPVKVASSAGKLMTIHDKDLWAAFVAKGH